MTKEEHGSLDSSAHWGPTEGAEDPGATIGRYRVVCRLGEGAMGMVYLAHDPQLERRVALKVLRRRSYASASTQEIKQRRLRREARAMAQLSHPNVVTVHDVGMVEGQVFVAMDYIPGRDLQQWLKSSHRSWKEVLRTFVAAGHGLNAAHVAGVIHRDFKPENVLVGDDGSVKVTDFGLARPQSDNAKFASRPPVLGHSLDRMSSSSSGDRWGSSPGRAEYVGLTRSGDVLGTPNYMAPELFEGGEATIYTDQFAFCVALYEGLYGVRPFAGDSMAALAFNMNRGQLTAAAGRSRVPAWLGRVVRRGLAAQSERRHPSMQALVDALVRGSGRRRRRAMGLGAVLVTVVGSSIAYGLTPSPAPCRGGEARVGVVWNPGRAATISAGFEATGLSYASEALDRAKRRLDAYSEAWVGAYTDICEATAVHGHQSPATLDLRISCLDQRLVELDELLEMFGHADERVAQQAVQAVSALRAPRSCASQIVVERQPALDRVREQLLRAEVRQNAGHYEDAATIAGEALAQAQRLEDAGLQSEALTQLGAAEIGLGSYEPAAEHFREAYFIAHQAGLDRVAARAAVELIPVEGIYQGKDDEGLQWGRHAQTLIERSDAAARLRGRYHAVMGSLYLQRFELENARDHYERALAIEREVVGEEHEQVAALLGFLAVVQEFSGRSEEAVRSFEKALEITSRALGPEHPQLAILHNNYAAILYERNDRFAAQAQLEQALRINLKSLKEHPGTATTMDNLGALMLSSKDYEQGRQLILRALAMRESILGPEHAMVAQSLSNYAESLKISGDQQGVRRTLDRALSILDKDGITANPYLKGDVLASLGLLALEQGAIQEGYEQCQRAWTLIDRFADEAHMSRGKPLVCLGWAELELGLVHLAKEKLERAYALRGLMSLEMPALVRLALAAVLVQSEGDNQRVHQLRADADQQFSESPYSPPERFQRWFTR